jgi:RNA polymerase sigma-70 factor (ECF subfamily)
MARDILTLRDVMATDAQTAVLADQDAPVALRMDEETFRGFYDRTSRMLWTYLYRMTNDRQAADDLMQETYYRFLRAEVAVEGDAHARHYLFRIATNLTRDGFRRARTRPAHVTHDDAQVGGDPAATRLDRRLDLAAAMAKLGARERAMLWLAYGQGASHKEIAAMVGVGTNSVKPLLFRARRRLAGILGRGADRT